MCLIAFEWNPGDSDSQRPTLLLAANRDEYYERPSQAAGFWSDHPDIYGGRDLLQGGTWLGVSTKYAPRMAAITNFHSLPDRAKTFPKSRGEIVTNFVKSHNKSAMDFCIQLETEKDDYSGFSAIFMDGSTLVCCSNRDQDQFCRILSPGVYGLSNHLLDTPWPKVLKAKAAITARRQQTNKEELSHSDVAKKLLKAFSDETKVSDRSLLPTTMGAEEEHFRSAVHVQGPTFGTRTTTILTLWDSNKCFEVTEKNYNTPGDTESLSHQTISID
jgi:uncharacterized protein with NRDE domain